MNGNLESGMNRLGGSDLQSMSVYYIYVWDLVAISVDDVLLRKFSSVTKGKTLFRPKR